MPNTTIQIRNVPEDLRSRLKIQASAEGLSISAYVMRALRKALDRPTRQETLQRLAAQPLRQLRRRPADVIRAQRDAR